MKANAFGLCLGLVLCVLAAIPCKAQTTVTLPYSFTGGADGAQPNSLIQAQDGNYYGTTAYGGTTCTNNTGTTNNAASGCGTIFQLSRNADGTTYTFKTLYEFTGSQADGGVPSGIVQGPDGYLYGTTLIGGTSLGDDSKCTDFNFNDTNDGGPAPCCIDGTGTNVGCGTLFKILPSQPPLPGQIDTLVSFDGLDNGAFPNPPILGLATDGKTPILFGSTLPCSNCAASGFLFSFIPSTSAFQSLSFGVSGLSYPNGLVQGECKDGANCDIYVYGSAQLGGSNTASCPSNAYVSGDVSGNAGCGGVFRYNVQTQTDSLLCNFGGSNSNNQAAATDRSPGSVAKTETVVRQSSARFPFGSEWGFNAVPISLLEASDGSIMGTTPWECFTGSSGYLLGASCGTGANDSATVFQCQPPASGSTAWTPNVIYQFTGGSVTNGNVSGTSDGGGSIEGLTLATDGNYYGSSGYGIFDVTATEIGTFLSSNSSQPPTQLAALNPYSLLQSTDSVNWMIQGGDGSFYGTAVNGGTDGEGVVFTLSASFDPPVQLCWQAGCSGAQINSTSQIGLGSSATLSWAVPNAFSLTSQQCYAFVESPNASTAGENWTSPLSGVTAGGVFSGSSTIKPTAVGTYNFAVTCGGTVTGSATLVVLTVPTVTVAPAASSIGTTQSLNVNVMVAGTPAPTGTVILSGGGYTSAATTLNAGSATITIPAGTLTAGSYTFDAAYTPDANSSSTYFSASGTASSAVDVTSPTYSMSATAVSLAPGGSASSTVTVSSSNGYAGTVTLSCSVTAQPSGAVDVPTCNGNQVSMSSGVTSMTVTVTVSTTGTSARLERRSPGARTGIRGAGELALAILVFLWIPRRSRRRFAILGMLIGSILLTNLAACGGGNSQNSGTTAGRYTITISGTGNDASKTNATTTFTLTVS